MDDTPTLLGFELIVGDLEVAVQFCERVLGLELVARNPSPDLAGEVAVFALGNSAINLLQPHPIGDGTVLSEREPRLAQIFLGVPSDSISSTAERIAAGGAPVQVLEPTRFFVPSSAVKGALGIASTITVLAVDEDVDEIDAPHISE